MRPRILVAALCAAALLLVAVPSQAAAWVLKVGFPDSQPRSGEPWPINVGAHRHSDGSPIHAAALYKFLFRGEVVATAYPTPHRSACGGEPRQGHPYHFYGHFRDRLCFPDRAVGIPLTLRVVVRAGPLGSKHRDHDVLVRP
jgi:hypothetical protein